MIDYIGVECDPKKTNEVTFVGAFELNQNK